MSKQLASIRTNINFSVEKGKNELVPQIEIVLLTYKPEYSFGTKDQILQKKSLDETRLILSTAGLNQTIANLKLALDELQNYEQMAVGLNRVIESMSDKK